MIGIAGRRAHHFEQQRDLIVARAVDVARPQDHPVTVEVAHDLLSRALGLMVR
jgi:hypothetical protein